MITNSNLLYNLKTKNMTNRLEIVFTVWAASLGVFAAVGIVYAAIQVVIGNTGGLVI